MSGKENARLARQIKTIGRKIPILRKPSRALMRRGQGIVRIPFALLMIAGGILSFLPVLGIWMLPLGLLFLAVDVPFLQRPISGGFIRIRRWAEVRFRSMRR